MDIVVDNCVMCKYESPILEDAYKEFFKWLFDGDGVIYLSRSLFMEYSRSNEKLSILIAGFLRNSDCTKVVKVGSGVLKKVNLSNRLTSNAEDHDHIRLVICSPRKKMITHDVRLLKDINAQPKHNKIKPKAISEPCETFYL